MFEFRVQVSSPERQLELETRTRNLSFPTNTSANTTARVYEEPEPHLFSFNSPFGACPTCQGFGNTIGVDYDLVIPNPLLSIKDGAIEPFTRPQHAWAQKELLKYAVVGEDRHQDAVRRPPRLPAEQHHLRRRRLARHQRVFQMARDEKIQASRPRLSRQISRLHDVSRMRRRSVCDRKHAT